MIVVKQKQIEDIAAMVIRHRRVLLVGCNTCAAVALAGGEKEVETLVQALRLATSRKGATVEFSGTVIQRQCEPEFVEGLDVDEYDAVLSLGCGAGVALPATQESVPVYPALDTMFIGSAQGLAHWRAECSACGSCVLGETAGICPVTRCAKGIMNGPCGGVKDGTCELGDRECAWVLIYERQHALHRDEDFAHTCDPKDNAAKTQCPEWDAGTQGGAK